MTTRAGREPLFMGEVPIGAAKDTPRRRAGPPTIRRPTRRGGSSLLLEPVIGLEVHVHLSTRSKLFCGCANVSAADEPNRFVCETCLGFPGTLPVANRQAVEWTVLVALALGCRVPRHATFARKSYFYPDLPKGYQISQYEEPLGVGGEVHVFTSEAERVVRIQRVHLEEDAAKIVHAKESTLVDHNRAGTPLVEIVTGPDLRSPAEARALVEDLQRTMRYLGVSRADLEHGDLRVDGNISLRLPAAGGRALATLGSKTEVKNLNSLRALERALSYEVTRQSVLWGKGKPPTVSSTRGWDERGEETVLLRAKEAEADYRYFPEPDIPPLALTRDLVTRLRQSLPELPHAKEERFRRQYRLSPASVRLLTEDRTFAAFAEAVFSELAEGVRERPDIPARDLMRLQQRATNYLLGDFRALLAATRRTAETTRVTPENFAELILLLHRAEVNRNAVPEILRQIHETGGDPSAIVAARGLGQVSDAEALRRIAQDVLREFPAETDRIRAGKRETLEFLVGQIMARTKHRANPSLARSILVEELGLS